MSDQLKTIQDLANSHEMEWVKGLSIIEREILKHLIKFFDDNHITEKHVAYHSFNILIANTVGRYICILTEDEIDQTDKANKLLDCLVETIRAITKQHIAGLQK